MGPMVVAAYWTDDERAIWELGARDSKLLSPARREQLASILERVGVFSMLIIPADSIDSARERMTLNELEVRCFSSAGASLLSGRPMLSDGSPEGISVSVHGRAGTDGLIKVDAADVIEERFGSAIRNGILDLVGPKDLEVLSLHKADRDHPSVSAASILAKVERDRAVRSISRELGEDIGSGYPSDPRTRAFLGGWVRRKGSLPPYCRKSWDTAKKLMAVTRQSKLVGF